MINTSILIALYFIEILKFNIGLRTWFSDQPKRYWISIVGGILYGFFVLTTKYEYSDIHIVMYVFVCVSLFFMLEQKGEKKFFRIIILFLVISCFDVIFDIILNSFFQEASLSNIFNAVIESMATLCVLLILLLIKIKIKLDTKSVLKFLREKIILVIIFMIILMLLTITGLSYLQSFIAEVKLKVFLSSISVLSIGCMVGLIMFIIYIKNVNQKLEISVETDRNLKQMQEKYYQTLLLREEDTRRYRHDMNNHLLCVGEIAKDECALETIKYIDKLKEGLMTIHKKCYVTGNKILDILLNFYLPQIENADVLVMGMCNCKLDISEVDFCSVFSNIILNSVEELQRMQSNNKYFRMRIIQKKFYLSVEVRNSSTQFSSNSHSLLGATKKKDKRNHGFGIRNICETVKRSGGSIEIKHGESEFSVTVLLRYSETSSKHTYNLPI